MISLSSSRTESSELPAAIPTTTVKIEVSNTLPIPLARDFFNAEADFGADNLASGAGTAASGVGTRASEVGTSASGFWLELR